MKLIVVFERRTSQNLNDEFIFNRLWSHTSVFDHLSGLLKQAIYPVGHSLAEHLSGRNEYGFNHLRHRYAPDDYADDLGELRNGFDDFVWVQVFTYLLA
jgi:hypothetical protein